jgi:hypothetical protein
MNTKELTEILTLKIIEKYINDGKVSEYNVVERYNTIYKQIHEDISNDNVNDYTSEVIE